MGTVVSSDSLRDAIAEVAWAYRPRPGGAVYQHGGISTADAILAMPEMQAMLAETDRLRAEVERLRAEVQRLRGAPKFTTDEMQAIKSCIYNLASLHYNDGYLALKPAQVHRLRAGLAVGGALPESVIDWVLDDKESYE